MGYDYESFWVNRSNNDWNTVGHSLYRSGLVQHTRDNDPMVIRVNTSNSGNNKGLVIFHRGTGGTFTGAIVSHGNNTTSYGTSSDYRNKENVVTLSGAIERVKKLLPKRFNFVNSTEVVDGFIAHECQEIVPEAATGVKDEMVDVGDLRDGDNELLHENIREPEELDEGVVWTKTGQEPVYQTVDYGKFTPLLTAALQEAIAKIEALELRLTALEAV